jgi:hypothetical protein
MVTVRGLSYLREWNAALNDQASAAEFREFLQIDIV